MVVIVVEEEMSKMIALDTITNNFERESCHFRRCVIRESIPCQKPTVPSDEDVIDCHARFVLGRLLTPESLDV